MKENALLLEQRNQFLGGLKEGFIALSEDLQSILYSNTASRRMLLTKKTESEGQTSGGYRALEIKDLD